MRPCLGVAPVTAGSARQRRKEKSRLARGGLHPKECRGRPDTPADRAGVPPDDGGYLQRDRRAGLLHGMLVLGAP